MVVSDRSFIRGGGLVQMGWGSYLFVHLIMHKMLHKIVHLLHRDHGLCVIITKVFGKRY